MLHSTISIRTCPSISSMSRACLGCVNLQGFFYRIQEVVARSDARHGREIRTDRDVEDVVAAWPSTNAGKRYRSMGTTYIHNDDLNTMM